jgi:hypothetical protein
VRRLLLLLLLLCRLLLSSLLLLRLLCLLLRLLLLLLLLVAKVEFLTVQLGLVIHLNGHLLQQQAQLLPLVRHILHVVVDCSGPVCTESRPPCIQSR